MPVRFSSLRMDFGCKPMINLHPAILYANKFTSPQRALMCAWQSPVQIFWPPTTTSKTKPVTRQGAFASLKVLRHIANLLDSLRNDLKPLADEARKREHEDREAQRGYG
jgi:hypothetical protein